MKKLVLGFVLGAVAVFAAGYETRVGDGTNGTEYGDHPASILNLDPRYRIEIWFVRLGERS